MKLTAKLAAATAVLALVTTTAATAQVTATRGASTPTVATTGTTVVGEAVRTDGTEQTLTSEAATAGTATQPRPAGTPASCADGAYTLSGYKVNATIAFGYNPAGAPATVTKTAGAAVRGSLLTVAAGANRCKLTHPIKAAATYTGATTHRAQLNASGACTGNDGYNTVSWGTLPTGYLAITCIYFAGGKVINADTLISTRYHWFTARPLHCVNTFDLQSVMTHEDGHTFGLSHVSPTAHGTETMGTLISPCDTTKRLLGRGDYAALARLYGTR